MQLRNKLLFYFVALVLITLAAFGLSAFQVASDAAIGKDMALLESLVQVEAEEMAEEYRQSRSLDHLVKHFTDQRSEHHIWLLIDTTYRAINYRENDSDFSQLLSEITLPKLLDNDSHRVRDLLARITQHLLTD